MNNDFPTQKTQVLVIGAGPGGYTAAFRAADLGLQVTLVEKEPELGGVCLNVGCIPSKALLHIAKVIEETKALGLAFKSALAIEKIHELSASPTKKLNQGLRGLAKQRKIKVIQGEARFSGTHEAKIKTKDGEQKIAFDYAIIAVGSRPITLPFLPKDPRIIDSTGALAMDDIPQRLLVIGGGIIGMEMATVYQALDAQVTVVEMGANLLGNADKDLVAPLQKRMQKQLKAILLETKVTQVDMTSKGCQVTFEGKQVPEGQPVYDKILCAIGRTPNGKEIDAQAAGVNVDDRGFIPVDKQLRTNVSHIFAIGDVVGNPMLAHKASNEGRIAAEVISGLKHFFEPKCIPSIAYTDPEVAWVGLTENEAKASNIPYEKASIPWMANGRSLTLGRDEGLTKLLFDPKTRRLLGAGVVGPNAGDLMGELGLAIEMGCEAEDISLTIHAHPTLSETIALAAEVFEGTATDLYMPKKK